MEHSLLITNKYCRTHNVSRFSSINKRERLSFLQSQHQAMAIPRLPLMKLNWLSLVKASGEL